VVNLLLPAGGLVGGALGGRALFDLGGGG
jgi:hypothetical protein